MTTSVLDVNDVVVPEELSIKEDCGIKGLEVVDDENGIVRALVSVTGIKDRVKDIIYPGAYADTLAARTPKGLVGHDWKSLVSKANQVKELPPGDSQLPKTLPDGTPWPADAGALYVEAQYNLNTVGGKEAYENAKFFGKDQEWSIGYSVPTGGATKDKEGVRHIKKLDLFEFSQVLWGAMPFARTMAVKEDAVVIENKEDGKKKLKAPITMADGSYPIQDEEDLHNAIQAYGRSKNHPACKKHIMHVAGLLGLSDLVPDKWKVIDPAELEGKDGDPDEPGQVVNDKDGKPLEGLLSTLSLDLAVKAFRALGAFLHEAGEIDDELATKVAGEEVENKAYETMFDVVSDLGADLFDANNLDEIKRLAVVYDFALDQEYPDVIAAAEGKIATFLADAIAAETDEAKQLQIKDIAGAMVELRDDEVIVVDTKDGGKPVDPPADPDKDEIIDAELVTINLSEFEA